MNNTLDFLVQTTYFTPLVIFFYGFYCSMNMGISKYYYKKYGWKVVVAGTLFFVNVTWLVYLGV